MCSQTKHLLTNCDLGIEAYASAPRSQEGYEIRFYLISNIGNIDSGKDSDRLGNNTGRKCISFLRHNYCTDRNNRGQYSNSRRHGLEL